MSSNRIEAPFTARFVEAGAKVFLELTNTTRQQLKCVEILTIFLKDEESPAGGPSQAHIRFDAIQYVQPQEKTVMSHRTWINGKPADPGKDQLERLQVISGEKKPYVLDISWEDEEGKSRFQRIPVGH
jgi:hypothetical protein